MFQIPEATSRTNFILGESSVLGVSHAAKARRDNLICRTVFWSVVTLFSACVTGWACYLVLDDYLGFPVVSVLETRLNKILEFPSVALCNLNPVPCNKLFERSLDYPALWKESSCSLGKQTTLEVSTILGTYQRLYGKIPAQYDVLTQKTDLLQFIAYTFIDSPTTRALLYDRNMTAILNDLDAFLLVFYSPAKMTTKYDDLTKQMGGPDVGATGYSVGTERLMLAIDRNEVPADRPGAFVIAVGDDARDEAFRVTSRLRERDVPCEMAAPGRSFKGQMRKADREGRRFVVLIGEEEIKNGRLLVKDMKTGEQKAMSFEEAAELLKKEQHDTDA